VINHWPFYKGSCSGSVKGVEVGILHSSSAAAGKVVWVSCRESVISCCAATLTIDNIEPGTTLDVKRHLRNNNQHGCVVVSKRGLVSSSTPLQQHLL
jgi:hypothetical protein